MQEFGRGGGGRGRGREKGGGAGLPGRGRGPRGRGRRRAGRAPLPVRGRAPALRADLPAGRCAAARTAGLAGLVRALGCRSAAPRARAGEGATFPPRGTFPESGCAAPGQEAAAGSQRWFSGHSEGFQGYADGRGSRGLEVSLKHGVVPVATHMRIYRKGDIVDIKGMGTVQKGMPHKYYHGKTGRVHSVTQHAVGIAVKHGARPNDFTGLIWSTGRAFPTPATNKGKILAKRINVRIEHIKRAKSRDCFLNRVRENQKRRKPKRKVPGFNCSSCLLHPEKHTFHPDNIAISEEYSKKTAPKNKHLPAGFMFVDVPLAKASHMVKPRINTSSVHPAPLVPLPTPCEGLASGIQLEAVVKPWMLCIPYLEMKERKGIVQQRQGCPFSK
ncbi:hypothetical protein QTO34_007722 [Cnephaeus nilssonii]|uniref:60S ribosomal protein L21 n=1 Tax=Cnephaeus nilssonii TaxID=3371016 RepID=A0AA40LH46_CNENI|nr:hypothetical protein QTO34_007722 [Eptesicus nilssonii]